MEVKKNILKTYEMFAGYGGASFSLKKAQIDFETVGYSEIDKFAIQCYNQNHINIKNYGDAMKINVNDLPDFDLLTGGFPCQSFSIAGKGLGELETRGTLFNEIIRIAEIKKPKYMLLENVKGLTFKNHKKTFDKILSELKRIGYNVKWKILNSKNYGVPQNRERVFFVCFRNDIDNSFFSFPKEEELKIFLKDILEEEVDEKYYLKKIQIEKILYRKGFPIIQKNNFCATILARDYKDPKCIVLNNPKHSNDRVYNKKGISSTLNTMQGGYRQPFIAENIKEYSNFFIFPRTKDGKLINGSYNRVWHKDFVGTINCINPLNIYQDKKIRKLTPKECFRLMGFFDDEINLEGLSNTQKYKLAGNGWDINLVSKIFKQMFKLS